MKYIHFAKYLLTLLLLENVMAGPSRQIIKELFNDGNLACNEYGEMDLCGTNTVWDHNILKCIVAPPSRISSIISPPARMEEIMLDILLSAAFVTAQLDERPLCFQLDDVAGSSIAAANLNTLAGVVASVEVRKCIEFSSGAVLTGTQFEVATALTSSTVTYPHSDFDVSITGAFEIDAALINMYNALAVRTTGDLIVTGTAFGDTLDASSYIALSLTKGLTLNGANGPDVITGTGFADVITGGAGADVITGGAGSDTFVFNSVSSADTIVDYTVADDSIQLSKAIFTGLGDIGALSSDEFVAGAGLTAAADGTDRIVYDTTSGNLYYDADGSGGDAAVQIATLTGTPDLLSSEFAIK